MGRDWVLIIKKPPKQVGFGYYANPAQTRPGYIYNMKFKKKNPNPKYKYNLNSFFISQLSHSHGRLSLFISKLSHSHSHKSTSSQAQAQLFTLSTLFRSHYHRSHTVAQPSVPLISLAHLPYPSPISHPASQPPSHGLTQPPLSRPRSTTPHGLIVLLHLVLHFFF